MLFTLLLLLVILCLVIYIINDNDLLSPSFMVTAIFLLGTIAAILGNLNWNMDINNPLFILAIMGGLISIWGGELLFYKKRTINAFSAKVIEIDKTKTLFLILINIFIVYMFYRRINTIAYSTGFNGEYLQMHVRVATSVNGVKLGTFFTFFIWIVQSTALLFSYVLANNFFIRKKIIFKELVLFIPIIAFFVQIYYSGSRAGLIRFFIILSFIIPFTYKCIYAKLKVLKIITLGIAVVFILLYSFAFLGTLTKKIDADDMLSPIYTYMGSSIVALDDWLQQNQILSSNYLGETSFSGTYSFINYLSGTGEKKTYDASSFTRKGKFSTNLYTGFRSYLQDFGWPGLFLICFFLGVFFGLAYRFVTIHPSPINFFVYAYFFVDLAYLLFAPSITSNLMTPTLIMGLLWLVIIVKFYMPKEKLYE